MYFHWGQKAAKKGTWSLWTAYNKPKSIETLAMVVWKNNRVVYIASSKSFEPERFARPLNNMEPKYIQEQQLNQFHCHNQNMLMECTRMWQSTGLISEWKNGDGSILLDVVLQNERVLQHIDRDEGGDSLCLSWLFEEILSI